MVKVRRNKTSLKKKKISKAERNKRNKEMRKEAKLLGDPYLERLVEELISLDGQIGKIKTLGKDELEFAKYEVGLTHNVSKEALKRERRRGQSLLSKEQKSLKGLRKYINKSLNILLDSRYTFHFDGRVIHFMDISKNINLEHRFMWLGSNSIYQENSFTSRWIDVFELEQRFKNDINMQKKEIRVGEWIKPDHTDWENAYGRADYNLMEGGFVDVPEATYKKSDMVPAMLVRFEFCFTQEAVRGAGGKYGHRQGAKFLTCLNDYFEKEAKKYPHVHDTVDEKE